MKYLHNQLSDCFNIWYRGKASEVTYNDYDIYGQISATKGKCDQIRAINATLGQI